MGAACSSSRLWRGCSRSDAQPDRNSDGRSNSDQTRQQRVLRPRQRTAGAGLRSSSNNNHSSTRTNGRPPLHPRTNDSSHRQPNERSRILAAELNEEDDGSQLRRRPSASVPLSPIRCPPGLPVTPVGKIKDTYRYCCPICYLFFAEILVSECCQNYVCIGCALGHIRSKARTRAQQPNGRGGSSTNLPLREIPEGVSIPVACPSCNTHGVSFSHARRADPLRCYVESPNTRAALIKAEQRQKQLQRQLPPSRAQQHKRREHHKRTLRRSSNSSKSSKSVQGQQPQRNSGGSGFNDENRNPNSAPLVTPNARRRITPFDTLRQKLEQHHRSGAQRRTQFRTPSAADRAAGLSVNVRHRHAFGAAVTVGVANDTDGDQTQPALEQRRRRGSVGAAPSVAFALVRHSTTPRNFQSQRHPGATGVCDSSNGEDAVGNSGGNAVLPPRAPSSQRFAAEVTMMAPETTAGETFAHAEMDESAQHREQFESLESAVPQQQQVQDLRQRHMPPRHPYSVEPDTEACSAEPEVEPARRSARRRISMTGLGGRALNSPPTILTTPFR